MRYIKEITTHQIEIDKSIFIAIIYPLNHVDDVSICLNDAKMKYPKANHYCYATIYGDQGEHQTASDDGEPSRTAGIPILEVLKHHDVTHILCVVIRYFGGIKLGAGGLVRAYTKATADVLKLAKRYIKKDVPVYRLTFDYDKINLVDKTFENNAEIIDKDYQEVVNYTVVLLDQDLKRLDDIKYYLKDFQHLGFKTIHLDES